MNYAWWCSTFCVSSRWTQGQVWCGLQGFMLTVQGKGNLLGKGSLQAGSKEWKWSCDKINVELWCLRTEPSFSLSQQHNAGKSHHWKFTSSEHIWVVYVGKAMAKCKISAIPSRDMQTPKWLLVLQTPRILPCFGSSSVTSVTHPHIKPQHSSEEEETGGSQIFRMQKVMCNCEYMQTRISWKTKPLRDTLDLHWMLDLWLLWGCFTSGVLSSRKGQQQSMTVK